VEQIKRAPRGAANVVPSQQAHETEATVSRLWSLSSLRSPRRRSKTRSGGAAEKSSPSAVLASGIQ